MIGWLAGRDHSIVTGNTTAQYCGMVNLGGGYPRRRGNVTGRAHVGAADVISPFTRGNAAIVAGNTTAQHLGVIHRYHRNPGSAVVTGLTEIRGVDVGGILACSDRAIMTAHARTQDLSVINPGRRYPVNGVVAGFANRG